MLSEKGGSSKKSSGGPSNSSSSRDKTPTPTVSVRPRIGTDVVLPQTKVKVIMKSSPEIDNIAADSVFIITKATEMFIDHLSNTALANSKGAKSIEYKNLSDVVHKNQNLEFLRDIIPIKIPARQALLEIAKQSAIETKELLE